MHNKISNFSPKNESSRYVVDIILLSEFPAWDVNQQSFIEGELSRMTANGEEIISVLPDADDLMVILKAPDSGGVA